MNQGMVRVTRRHMPASASGAPARAPLLACASPRSPTTIASGTSSIVRVSFTIVATAPALAP